MAVLAPVVDRLSVSGVLAVLVEDVSPSLNRDCDHCDKPIDFDEESWFWSFGDIKVRLHVPCFLDWMRRLQPDIDKCKGAGSDRD